MKLTTSEALEQQDAADRALWHLQQARDLLTIAKAPKTLARTRLAISSARGAVRNTDYRVARARSAT
jgi:hypothetical protein